MKWLTRESQRDTLTKTSKLFNYTYRYLVDIFSSIKFSRSLQVSFLMNILNCRTAVHSQISITQHLFFNSIDKRRNEVLERRQKIKERAEDRHNALLAAQGFQEFKRDADEVSSFSHNLNYNSVNLLYIKVGLQYLKYNPKVEICELVKMKHTCIAVLT